MNTAQSTSAIASSAPPTSSMVLWAAYSGSAPGQIALNVLDDDDGVVQLAQAKVLRKRVTLHLGS